MAPENRHMPGGEGSPQNSNELGKDALKSSLPSSATGPDP